MPSKKKKYNARFPAGRIKKIMQTDEEIGKVAQAVPVIISRTLELFVESLLTKTLRITNARNAKTLSPSHLKQCIMAESRFDFLRELVKNVPISDNQFDADPFGGNNSNDNSSTNVSSASLSGGGTNGQHPDETKSNSVTPPGQSTPTPMSFNFYGSFDNKTAATPATLPLSNNLNFYTEIASEEKTNCDTNRSVQHHQLLKRANTTTAPPPFKPKLPKLSRLNSAPSTVTSTTIQQQPMPAAAPSTPQFTISIPSPQQLSQPVIKLDYSHLAQQFSAAAASTSFSNQQPVPTISIDFSNYSNATATATATNAATASTNGLDEDYDDI